MVSIIVVSADRFVNIAMLVLLYTKKIAHPKIAAVR